MGMKILLHSNDRKILDILAKDTAAYVTGMPEYGPMVDYIERKQLDPNEYVEWFLVVDDDA